MAKALAHARGQLAPNYHVTFSRSETNEADCLRVLEAGGNVAVVFAGASQPNTSAIASLMAINQTCVTSKASKA